MLRQRNGLVMSDAAKYACQQGDHAMRNVLSASRAAERQATERGSPASR